MALPLSQIASFPVQILVAAMKFFLGKDETEKNESDSESEASTEDWIDNRSDATPCLAPWFKTLCTLQQRLYDILQ